MSEAFFISFEGIDGSGKSTMLRRLQSHLEQKGLPVVATFEPGGSTLGRQLRWVLLNREGAVDDARTEALLFAAERAAHVNEIIRPALLAEKIVLCDRFVDSTIAYQGGGRGLNTRFLQQLNLFATGGLLPDLSFFFDLPLTTARARQNRDKDRLESEDEAFYRRIIVAYEQLLAEEGVRMRRIDADQPPDAVFAQLLQYLPYQMR